jgi:hypothetical protein
MPFIAFGHFFVSSLEPVCNNPSRRAPKSMGQKNRLDLFETVVV